LKFSLRRALGFIRALSRSKRGIIGALILVVAVGVALTAPFLTPYDPIWSTGLSGKLVPPSWEKYLPGSATLTQGMIPVDESSLLRSTNPLKEFNFTVQGAVQAISNTATITTNVTVKATLSVVISPTSAILDVGQPQLFTSSVAGGTPPYSYQWYLNGATVPAATGTSWIFAPSSAGSYTVYVVATDSAASPTKAKSSTAQVTVNPELTVTVSPTNAMIYLSQSQNFTALPSGGTSPYTYHWYQNSTLVSGATSRIWTFTPTSTGVYPIYVNVTDGVGEVALSLNAQLTVNPKPSILVTISPSDTVTDLNQSVAFNSSITGGTSPFTYQWYLNDSIVTGATSSTWNFTHTSAAHYKVYLKVTDSLAAKGISNVAFIIVNPLPTVSISPTTVVMDIGQNQTFTSSVANGTVPYSYQWYLNGATVPAATGTSWIFAPSSAGSYTVYVVAIDSATSSVHAQSKTVQITVNSQVTVTISPLASTIYVYESQVYTSSVSGGTSPYSYQWYLNGQPVSGATSATWTFTPPWPLGVLTQSVYVRVTDSVKQGADSSNATINLEGSFVASISPTSVILNVGQSQVFTSNVTGGNGLYSYQWFLSGSPVSGANYATWSFTPPSPGSYSVYLKVNDNLGIEASRDVTVQYSAFGTTGSNGSLEIIFQPDGLPINSNLTIQIMRDFNYPYSGIPGSMINTGTILASRIEGIAVSPALLLEQNWLKLTSQGTASHNITKIEFGQSIINPGAPAPAEYSENDFTGQYASAASLGWQSPKAPPIYQASQDPRPLEQLFPTAGSYSYGISLTATELTANAGAIVFVDNVRLNLQGTSWGLLGTDEQGRDVFTELVYGTQVSLYVGLVAAFLSTIIGLIVGLVAAYMGGVVDEVLMRFTDALLVLPTLPLMIVLIIALTGGAYNINILIIVFGVLGWTGFARVVRSQVLSLKERPYVEAAKAVGAGTPYILWRHILPNVIVLVYVTLALTVPAAIVTEAAFAFLGFIDASHMSWGRMLTALQLTPSIWWVVIPPGLAIMILSLSFILIGYAIDDILNPKLRARR